MGAPMTAYMLEEVERMRAEQAETQAELKAKFPKASTDQEYDAFIDGTLAGLDPSRKETHLELVGAWLYENYQGADKGKTMLAGWSGRLGESEIFWRTYTGTVDGLALNRQVVDMAELDSKVTTPDSNQKPRFPLQWASSVWEKSEPLEYLVDKILPLESVNLLVGEPGCKKTWSVLDLAVSVATGKEEWLGLKLKQATVLIIDEESGERRLRRRLYETLNGHLIDKGTEVPIAFTSLSMMNFRNDDDVTALHMLIEQTGAKLVIIDALADVTSGADENSVGDMQPLLQQMRSIANATKSAFVVIHHSNKATGEYRGSTSIKGSIDGMLMVESAPESKFVTFKASKLRDEPEFTWSAEANFVKEAEQFWLSSSDNKEKGKKFSVAQREVLGYLLEYGNSALSDVLNSKENDMISTKNSRKEAYLGFLSSGHIHRTNAGGKGVPAIIELTETGTKLAESLK